MSTGTVSLPHAPGAASQGTLIESNRVAAEVYAAILVAQQCPRDEQKVREDTTQLCRMEVMAKRAFFKYPKGGTTITGPTIQLAKELVRIWRNTQWGIVELDRKEGRSELLAYAWDCETNSRSSRIVIVQHKSDRSGRDPVDLTDMRDIMTNNTNIASRHLRETIWTVLPLWLTELAVDLCHETVDHGGGVPLVTRIANCIDKFTNIGVRKEQLVTKLYGRPTSTWDGIDIETLGNVWKAINSGQTTVEAEFPPVVISAVPHATVVASSKEPAPSVDTSELDMYTDQEAALPFPDDSNERIRLMFDLFIESGIGTSPADRAKRLQIITGCLELPKPPGNVNELTVEQLGRVLQFMFSRRAVGDLAERLEAMSAPAAAGDQ